MTISHEVTIGDGTPDNPIYRFNEGDEYEIGEIFNAQFPPTGQGVWWKYTNITFTMIKITRYTEVTL